MPRQQWQRDRQKKHNRFNEQNKTLHVHHAFLYISFAVTARLQRENALLHTFMEDVNKRRRNFLALYELAYGS